MLTLQRSGHVHPPGRCAAAWCGQLAQVHLRQWAGQYHGCKRVTLFAGAVHGEGHHGVAGGLQVCVRPAETLLCPGARLVSCTGLEYLG